jgi:hypothetical protein
MDANIERILRNYRSRIEFEQHRERTLAHELEVARNANWFASQPLGDGTEGSGAFDKEAFERDRRLGVEPRFITECHPTADGPLNRMLAATDTTVDIQALSAETIDRELLGVTDGSPYQRSSISLADVESAVDAIRDLRIPLRIVMNPKWHDTLPRWAQGEYSQSRGAFRGIPVLFEEDEPDWRVELSDGSVERSSSTSASCPAPPKPA